MQTKYLGWMFVIVTACSDGASAETAKTESPVGVGASTGDAGASTLCSPPASVSAYITSGQCTLDVLQMGSIPADMCYDFGNRTYMLSCPASAPVGLNCTAMKPLYCCPCDPNTYSDAGLDGPNHP